jgi:2-C-methyl-D-erythritol 4-phosphate cytidylyltransferase
MVVALVLAGGIGKRVGAEIPKQYIEVMGKPIIVYTLEKLNNHPKIDHIIVACLESYIDLIYVYAKKYKLHKIINVFKGGDTFQESAMNGVYALKGLCNTGDIVFIHLANFPMVGDEIITDSIDICRKYGNAFSAESSRLCLCEKTGDICSNKYLDRALVYGLSSPWVFYYEYLYNLYTKAQEDHIDFNKIQHISTLMLNKGETIYFSKASSLNIKITTKEDIDLFEGLLLLQRKRQDENIAN